MVIATAFDRDRLKPLVAVPAVQQARPATEPPVPRNGGLDRMPTPQREIRVPLDADDIPLFRRPKEAPATAGAVFADGQGFAPKYKEGSSDDALDVPTFLRKQFD